MPGNATLRLGRQPWIDVDARLLPLSLAEVGQVRACRRAPGRGGGAGAPNGRSSQPHDRRPARARRWRRPRCARHGRSREQRQGLRSHDADARVQREERRSEGAGDVAHRHGVRAWAWLRPGDDAGGVRREPRHVDHRHRRDRLGARSRLGGERRAARRHRDRQRTAHGLDARRNVRPRVRATAASCGTPRSSIRWARSIGFSRRRIPASWRRVRVDTRAWSHRREPILPRSRARRRSSGSRRAPPRLVSGRYPARRRRSVAIPRPGPFVLPASFAVGSRIRCARARRCSERSVPRQHAASRAVRVRVARRDDAQVIDRRGCVARLGARRPGSRWTAWRSAPPTTSRQATSRSGSISSRARSTARAATSCCTRTTTRSTCAIWRCASTARAGWRRIRRRFGGDRAASSSTSSS